LQLPGNKIAPPAVVSQVRTIAKPGLRLVPTTDDPAATAGAREKHLAGPENRDDFQRTFLPYLDAAYNLARWVLKNEADAQDVVQEAYLRALRFSGTFRGGDPRAWLLTIVRNTAYTWLSRNRSADPPVPFEEEQHSDEALPVDIELIRRADSRALRMAMEGLPTEFREIVVLRDLEGLSYKEIAEVADLPIGTVMSRLARARSRLKQALHKLSYAGGRP
jgi:RNA polymerase sigma-70 factor (ECF subfamily)